MRIDCTCVCVHGGSQATSLYMCSYKGVYVYVGEGGGICVSEQFI